MMLAGRSVAVANLATIKIMKTSDNNDGVGTLVVNNDDDNSAPDILYHWHLLKILHWRHSKNLDQMSSAQPLCLTVYH